MSRAAKLTFASTTILSIATVSYVYKLQRDEREALHQGPIKDMQRVQLKKQLANADAENKQTQAQKVRQNEYELQKSLREQYSKVQNVSESPGNRPN